MIYKKDSLRLSRSYVVKLMSKYGKKTPQYAVLEEVLLFMNLQIGAEKNKHEKFQFGDTKQAAKEFVQTLALR